MNFDSRFFASLTFYHLKSILITIYNIYIYILINFAPKLLINLKFQFYDFVKKRN